MNLELARANFHARYLDWALAHVERELECGFPSLQSFKAARAAQYLAAVEALGVHSRKEFCVALTKVRFAKQRHKAPALQANQHPSENEFSIAEKFFQSRFTFVKGRSSDESLSRVKVSRKQLRKKIIEHCGGKLGEGELPGSPSYWAYKADFGRFKLRTTFDVGARTFALSYSQHVTTEANLDLSPAIGILAWFGISGQTDWEGATGIDEDVIARAAVQCSLLFKDSCAALLSDLPDV